MIPFQKGPGDGGTDRANTTKDRESGRQWQPQGNGGLFRIFGLILLNFTMHMRRVPARIVTSEDPCLLISDAAADAPQLRDFRLEQVHAGK